MKKRMRFFNVRMPEGLSYIRVILFFVVIGFCLNAYLSIQVIDKGLNFAADGLNYLVWQLNFAASVVLLLITMVFILHHGFGALMRMESILDVILKGDYSQRIYLRKRDVLRPFVSKINKILDLLEKASPKK